MSTQQTGGLKPTRRTLVKGAAWSVPVVAMANPVLAQDVVCSPNSVHPDCNPVDPEFIGNWCKHSGNPKYYHNTMSWTNTNQNCQVTVTLGQMNINGVKRQAYASIGGQSKTTFTLAPNQEVIFPVDAGLYGNSANGAATLSYSWTITCPTGDPVTGSATIEGGTLNDSSLPPCGTGADPGGNPGDEPPHDDGSPFTSVDPDASKQVESDDSAKATEDLTVKHQETTPDEAPAEVIEDTAPVVEEQPLPVDPQPAPPAEGDAGSTETDATNQG
ncbi:hypothetical protein [Ornithinimicrobium panacihumi]|uniref:hypothetical protein n=1 Tax=Ornithinimicrobium panacihumi TaxID=2008449 RepID=UPI003F8C4AF7